MMELKQKLLHKTFPAFIDVGTSSSETCSDRSLKYDMRGKKSFQSGKIHWRRNHQRVSSASQCVARREKLEPRPGPGGGGAELERAAPVQRPEWPDPAG